MLRRKDPEFDVSGKVFQVLKSQILPNEKPITLEKIDTEILDNALDSMRDADFRHTKFGHLYCNVKTIYGRNPIELDSSDKHRVRKSLILDRKIMSSIHSFYLEEGRSISRVFEKEPGVDDAGGLYRLIGRVFQKYSDIKKIIGDHAPKPTAKDWEVFLFGRKMLPRAFPYWISNARNLDQSKVQLSDGEIKTVEEKLKECRLNKDGIGISSFLNTLNQIPNRKRETVLPEDIQTFENDLKGMRDRRQGLRLSILLKELKLLGVLDTSSVN